MLSIEILGLPELEQKLLKFEQSVNVEEILDQASSLLLARIRQRFLAEVDPDNVPWIPSFAGIRRRAAGGPGTLFDTGRLFHSIQLFADGPNERTIGTDVPYAAELQKRPDRNWVFLGFGEEDKILAQEFVIKRISEALA